MVEWPRAFKLVTTLAALFAAGCLSAITAHAATGITAFTVTPTTSQAGGHPDFSVHATWLNRADAPIDPCECDDARTFALHLPTGFIGNPNNLPTCTLTEFNLASCPEASQVGTTEFGSGIAPLYNMEPHPNQAALIAFTIPFSTAPAFVDLSGRTESDYGLDSTSAPIFHLFPIFDLKFTIWGVPGDPSHDSLRFRTPLTGLGVCNIPGSLGGHPYCDEGTVTGAVSPVPPAPYLQNPTTCGVPLSAGLDLSYYNGVTEHADYPWPATTGCQQLRFNPSLTAVPTTSAADTAAGIDIDLKVPQIQSPTTPSPSEIRSTTVTLPQGFTINPNAADGKLTCTDTESAIGLSRGPATCPELAKVGTLSLDSSALPGPIPGAIYLGEPKPGNRYRLILAADGFGTHIKLAGSVFPDPQTGQIVTSFTDLPQSPLTEFSLHFFGSERGLLATPPQCGTYEIESDFVPWDSALPTKHSLSSFTIGQGPDGGPCPGVSRPFDPRFGASVVSNVSAAHTPFWVMLTRPDGDQFLTGLTVTTPPGFAATLKGIPYCPESAIAQLNDSSYSGLAEQLIPACPESSQVGTAEAAAGAGTHPLYTPGKVYLAGPYKGAPLSLEVVVPAVSGPYDLGVVAVRAALSVDPITAQVTTVSDPLPQILAGIPLRVRQVLVNLDRKDFALNPTNCDPFSVDATVTGDQGAIATPSYHFQVANCADLGFSPKLSIALKGASTARNGHPALHATFAPKPGDANAKQVVVTLPSTMQLDSFHIGTACTKAQFGADQCPAKSQIGTASASSPLLDDPLKGNVYLVSAGNKLPDLVAALRGKFSIDLHGVIDTSPNGGLRTTFKTVPDVPVTSFSLDLAGGKKGLIVYNTNVCVRPQKATALLDAQNGRTVASIPRINVEGCHSAQRHRRHHQRHKHHRARNHR